MNIKDLFDKAENGTLTYDQFVNAANESKAKFVDLSEGNYVDKQKYTDDLSSRDTRITSLDDSLKARDTDLAKLQEQLANAGTDATKLGELSNNLDSLQKQYDKDTKALQKQLKEQAYKFAVNKFADEQNFTSNAAKRDFISTLMAKNLQMENDTILGASDFKTAYANENADAFVVEEPEEPKPSKPQPRFVDTTNSGNNNNNEPSNPFNFEFIGVRPHK